jgi:TonB family protein
MFTNLIESQSHRREFKRRSSFFLITVSAYAVILFGAGIASIYAYDAQLEMQSSGLELLSWVPPVAPVTPKPIADHPQPVRRNTSSNATIDRHIDVPVRTQGITTTNDPTKVPDRVGTQASPVPPVTGNFRIGTQNLDPPTAATDNSGNCIGCPSKPPTVTITDKPPEPPLVKPPKTERVTSQVLSSKAVNLPQPPYPIIAKQAHVQGPVSIQILVSEEGKVVSAQVVSGNPMLSTAAKDAAMRARFTPTILNGQAVKIQGVITYNFVLQ